MTQASEETFREKVRAIFAERFGDGARVLDAAVDGVFTAAVVAAYPDLGVERAADLAFHLSDWRSDGAFLLALSLAPERFTAQEVAEGVMAFLIHAPNHVVAAAKLGGFPVSDIFEVGTLAGDREPNDPAV
jgi:hypothetical protein